MSGEAAERTRVPGADALRVVDLFCGPGGLSEGFHQAGFQTIFALDYDKAAVETYRANNPGVETVHSDIRDVSPADIPDCDVLIGGPPCTTFSSSNRGGNGNVLEGLELVQAFLRIVHYKQPRWWVMENVPRITKFLPPEVPLRWIGIDSDGHLAVPQRNVFNAADYGVPQTRKRFLMGAYPPPDPNHDESGKVDLFTDSTDLPRWKTLAQTLSFLPSPSATQAALGEMVEDPNYELKIPVELLTDHFMDTHIPSDELGRLRRAKEEHPFMGRMAFPDDVDRPARTVVATQLGRETLVLVDEESSRFRRLTVREVACLQSFPITYQFFGGATARYRLVGDAVPPRLAYNIACEILSDVGLPRPDGPRVEANIGETPSPIVTLNARTRRNHKKDRRFTRMLPGKELRGCRAELANIVDDVENVSWRAVLHVGEGRQRRELTVTPRQALKALQVFRVDEVMSRRLDEVISDLSDALKAVPLASDLQAAWIAADGMPQGPDTLVEMLATVIDRHFPRGDFSSLRAQAIDSLPILRSNGIPLRLAIGLVAAAQAALLANTPNEERGNVSDLVSVWHELNAATQSGPNLFA